MTKIGWCHICGLRKALVYLFSYKRNGALVGACCACFANMDPGRKD